MYRSTIPPCLVALTMLLPMAAGAAVSDERQPGGREKISIIGAYGTDMESQFFFPCDRHERWRVTDTSGLSREYASLVPNEGQPFFVQASGYVSSAGAQSQPGSHNRAMLITDYTVTLNPPLDCVLNEAR